MIAQGIASNTTFAHYNRQWMPVILLALVFFIPVSSTAKSIILSIVTPLILLIPECRERLFLFLKTNWAKSAYFFVLLALLGCVWSHAFWQEKILVLQKYGKLIYLPIIAAGFIDNRIRNRSICAFLVAMSVVCCLSILKYMGVIHFNGPDPGQIFQNHIMTGLMMSLAAYFSALYFFQNRQSVRWGWLLLALIFSWQVLFIGTGRTGYVIYFVLMLTLFVQIFSFRHAICSIFLSSLLIIGVFCSSSVMRTGVTNAYNEYISYQSIDKNTPVGFRLQFHELAYDLFKARPFIGNGTAGFTSAFRENNYIPSWGHRLLEPHSQYWLIASEFGFLGIVLYLLFLGFLLRASLRLGRMRPIALGIFVAFFLGSFSDSLLFYSGTGYFFIVMMALVLSETSTSATMHG